jgi:hypothetical protein
MYGRNRYEEQLAFFSASITKQDRILYLFKDFTVRVKKFVRAETINASLFINLYKDFDFVLYSSWYNNNFIPLLNYRFIIKQNVSLGISRNHMTKNDTILTDFPS